MPAITAIVTTYRRPQLLRAAVESVLAQTYGDFQLRIYDDASGDETPQVARELARADGRVVYRGRESNLGPYRSFQLAVSEVDTPYFSIMAEDDLLLPGFYRAALTAFTRSPEAMLAATQVVHVDDERRVIEDRRPYWSRPGLFRPPEGYLLMLDHLPPTWTGVLFKQEAMQAVGGIDPGVGPATDYEFELRIAACQPFATDPTPGAVHVHHEGALSAGGKLEMIWPYWGMVREKLAALDCLDAVARRETGSRLDRHIVDWLFKVGIGAARRGRWQDAREASRLLEHEFNEPNRSRLVSATVALAMHVPPTRGLLRLGSELRRPYARRWGRRQQLDDYLGARTA